MSSLIKPVLLFTTGLIAALPGPWHPPLAAQVPAAIAIRQITNAQDKITFTFTSTWPEPDSRAVL